MTELAPENWWFNTIRLSDEEEVSLWYPANHTQGRRAVGGKLVVTSNRFAFAPNRLDSAMGGKVWELSLSDFASVGIDKPRLRIAEVFSGALRARLAVHTHDGGSQYFVVANPEVIKGEIDVAVQSNRLLLDF